MMSVIVDDVVVDGVAVVDVRVTKFPFLNCVWYEFNSKIA